MSRPRFFTIEELPDSSPFLIPLSVEDAKHAARVLRVTPGEELELVAPSGRGWRVQVVAVSREGMVAELAGPLVCSWSPHVALVQGVAKGDKMDSIVRQSVEVGVSEIVPVVTSRTVVRLDERKRAERGDRWRRIAVSAAKQARRDRVPAVSDPLTLDEAIGLLGDFDATIVLWEECEGPLLSAALRPLLTGRESRIAIVVGPEGGLSAEEVARLEAAGAATASLGSSVMRTETAAVVATALAVSCGYEMDTRRNG